MASLVNGRLSDCMCHEVLTHQKPVHFFMTPLPSAGAPLIFVVPWITVKYLYENEE